MIEKHLHPQFPIRVEGIIFRTFATSAGPRCRFTNKDWDFARKYRILGRTKRRLTLTKKANHILITQLLNAVAAAKGVVPLASLNEHFSTPQTVSSTFTGRKADLNTLRQCFQAQSSTSQNHVQKRFVIYGLPGSGKTQFCCKYASDNKQRQA